MTKVVIDKEAEITKLENMLENLTDDKDKQSVRFAINVINGFEPTNEIKKNERPKCEWLIVGEEQGAFGVIYRIRKCSRCGWEHSLVIPDNYCPNCGLAMKGEKNEC